MVEALSVLILYFTLCTQYFTLYGLCLKSVVKAWLFDLTFFHYLFEANKFWKETQVGSFVFFVFFKNFQTKTERDTITDLYL